MNFILLRDKRDELDLSNPELAAKVKVSTKYLENILCGHDAPSMRLIYRFARTLGLDAGRIVVADAKPTGDPSDPPKQPGGGPKSPPKRGDTEKRTSPRRNTSERVVA